jgi:hypothetical protein
MRGSYIGWLRNRLVWNLPTAKEPRDALGVDGRPVISHADLTRRKLKVIRPN